MNILPIQPRHTIIPLDGWQSYRRDGEQFLRTAVNAHQRGNPRFNPEITYNLVAMAIEKLIMALLMQRGALADTPTMVDLLAALQRHLGPLPGLTADFAFLDDFQQICALETYHRRPPAPADIGRIVAIGLRMRELLAPHLYPAAPASAPSDKPSARITRPTAAG
jgi:hypothetical protein